jgi:membrane glycosyltransferase
MRAHNYLLTPEETKSPALLRHARLHASQPAKPQLKDALAA